MYARGILFGKMKYELGDTAVVRCPETGLEVNLEFKVKGWVGGTYNAIGGFIKDSKSGKNLYELSGLWSGEMSIKDLATGKKEVLFDATRAKPSFPKSRPLEEQSPRESQKLWATTTAAIKKADQKVATDEKSRIEDEQRKEASERGENAWQPKLFRQAPPGDEEQLDWILDAEVDSKAPAEAQVKQILAIAPILPGQEATQGPPRSEHQPAPQSQTTPSSGGGGNDLIDFGQNDKASIHPPQPKQPGQPAQAPQPLGQMLQSPLMPRNSSNQANTNQPVKRMDSLGNEEMFVDADP